MGYTILLIEDDHDLRETTLDLLRDEDFNTLSAQNGAQGIQLAIQYVPDIIVCDINMPGLSGYEVYNMLHQINTTATIPFIFLSAKTSRDDILTGLHLGADDYITKPFDFNELVDIIKRRIERKTKITSQEDEKFRILFENTHTAAFILNRSTIEYANKAFSTLMGFDLDQLKGLPVTNILHGDSLSPFSLAVNQCMEGIKKSFCIPVLAIQRGNAVIEVELMASLIQFKGQPSLICTLSPKNQPSQIDNALPVTDAELISDREIEVLRFICEGLTNTEIADKLYLSERTIEGHRSRLFAKTGTKNAVALAMWAVKNNFYRI